MSGFDDRERNEEKRFRHEQDLGFKIRNRRNRLLGLWIAQDFLGLEGEAATAYAKEIVLADFEAPGDADVLARIRTDLDAAGKSLSDHLLEKRMAELAVTAKQQVMSE